MGVLVAENSNIKLYAGGDCLILVESGDGSLKYSLDAPLFEIQGEITGGKEFIFHCLYSEKDLANGGREIVLRYRHSLMPELLLDARVRYFPSSIIRFNYTLRSQNSLKLTKLSGKDNICYTGMTAADDRCKLTEIQFSHFDGNLHSFMPCLDMKEDYELTNGIRFVGPIALMEADGHSCLLAYEHGAEHPDGYLEFISNKSENGLKLMIKAKKGNYYNGQLIGKDKSFESCWFHFALCGGDRTGLFKLYREFFQKYICLHPESRKPYIYYDTWNRQERNHDIKGMKYLDEMHMDHILKEIDIIHRLGADVFLVEVAWYNKTGDWKANMKNFPDALKKIKERLDAYAMKLGLWFNPTVAAGTSWIYNNHPEYAMTVSGRESWFEVWETEESCSMCLASDYSDFIIDKLVELNKTCGATHFKLDAVEQYGCDSPFHNHGNEYNSPGERQECFSYQMGVQLTRIATEVTDRCPDVIVDFDITEQGRFVGLSYLSAGRYYLMNNGPYYRDFDIPEDYVIKPYTNVFFHPGAARPRVCRQFTKYDSIVPSNLFLTHFLPDSPAWAQDNSIASMFLGGNGIWGDPFSLTEEDISYLGEAIRKYKQVAGGVTGSYPKVKGFIGSSPEIHEKIDTAEAEGIICFFTKHNGLFTYYTQKINLDRFSHADGADEYEITSDGRLKITVRLDDNQARVVYVFARAL